MGWRDASAFLYIWLALLLFMALAPPLAGLLARCRTAMGVAWTLTGDLAYRPPGLLFTVPESLRLAYELSTLLFVPPIIAALASLSRPLRDEPAAAFLLGFLTFSLSPFSWLRARPPYHIVMLAVSTIWGLGCASLTKAEDPRDPWARVGYLVLFITWWFSLGGLMD